MQQIELRHAHIFCGNGSGAKGFNRANARVGQLAARSRCIGGIDVMPGRIRDFGRAEQGGTPGTVMDLFDRDQYRDFHEKEPPAGWREALPADIRRAFGNERPDVIFLSAPCKGFSGLLPEATSKTRKYQALNRLTVRGLWLALEAYADDPVDLYVFENVPRIMTRGRKLLDQIGKMFQAYGYLMAETKHDCGEIGRLHQSRKRFLMVARHPGKVPPFLYEPPKFKLRPVGELLDRMPLPGLLEAGPMHRVPALQWKTWVRLAFVEAGGDWRSLGKLAVEDGHLRDFRLVPEEAMHRGVLGVHRWEDSSGAIAGRSGPTNGAFAVADPRREDGRAEYGQYGIKRWDEASQAIIGKAAVGAGSFAVADPRHHGGPKHNNVYRVVAYSSPSGVVSSAHGAVADPRPAEGRYPSKYRVTRCDEAAGTVISASTTGDGAFAVADPNCPNGLHNDAYGVRTWENSSGAVTAEGRVQNGAFAVADPRPSFKKEGAAYTTSGHYGVLGWGETAKTVSGCGQADNGHWSVADPRIDLPAATDQVVARIRALDGTWHRPFTTLELAALQGMVDPEAMAEHGNPFVLDGASDSDWRESIGNAVPPPAAQAIAETMFRTLLLARSGGGFMLSDVPIWVRPVAIALSLSQQIIREAA